MSDKREHLRTPITCSIKIVHPELGEMLVKTRDLSDGGVFVLLDPEQAPPIGSHVTGQVQGLAENAPIVAMEVVRAESEGIGLRFLEQE